MEIIGESYLDAVLSKMFYVTGIRLTLEIGGSGKEVRDEINMDECNGFNSNNEQIVFVFCFYDLML